MIDLSSKRMLSPKINPLIDAAIVADREKEPKRNYLGGSRLGVECERALQFEFFHAPKDAGKDFDGRLYRVFQRGHWVEDAVINWIELAGVEIVTRDEDDKQFEFSEFNGLIKGHCDGIVIGGPEEFGPFPRLWENKGLQQKDWLAIKKHGLRKKSSVYYGQNQVYMGRFGLTENPALFSAVNMNTMEIYWESITYNESAEKQLMAKGARILNACMAGELLPRLSQDPSFYICKMCSYSERCFSF